MSQETLTIILTGVIAAATFAYSILTFFVLRETTALRKVETDPLLAVYIQAEDESIHTANLVIQNIGRGPAYNLRWEFNNGDPLVKFLLKRSHPINLPNMGFFKGWRYMAPSQKYDTFIGSFVELLKSQEDIHMDINTSYENRRGETFRQSFRIDPTDYWGRIVSKPKSFPDLIRATEGIEKSLREIHSQLARGKEENNS
jgi:hypothetical protein